ncbi:MAG TPA: hypothetical protein VFQ61_08615 [Polyangiaceae bacterium]|nr:hypothetical protein [Polyangiaceae bacterium]
MNKLVSLFAGAGLLAMGCASGSESADELTTLESTIAASPATLTYTSDTGTAYCATITMPNAFSTTGTGWFAGVDVKTNTITSVSGAVKSASTGKVVFKPSGAVAIPGGANASFSFCATASGPTVRPTIVAWNITTAPYATCQTNSGVYPTKAALAVTMAMEVGRWQPNTDLAIQGTIYQYGSRVILSSAALSACAANGKTGCPNTKALLGQQDASFVDQNLFNATNYWSDLENSFGRQTNLIQDLTRNNSGALPPAHKLTLVAGPTNIGGPNACGPHYVFQVDNTAGQPLTSTQAANMVNAMCFYGAGSCGPNPYIGFQVTTANGCPSGKTCIAIDPEDGDTGSTSTTSAGSAPTYPANRVYNPDNSLLGTACITIAGTLKTLVSQCSNKPATCGYLYCM